MLKTQFSKNKIEAGCDEAGRGCLAGPVVAAAVILPSNWNHPLLNDSKKLKESDRNELRSIIEEVAEDYAVSFVDEKEIDQLNILKASFTAMHRAIDQLQTRPQQLIIDGNRFIEYQGIPHECIIKGDGKYTSIAAASILAKTYRDEFMITLHNDYPIYGWEKNKGYPTIQHRNAIVQHGPCKYHRKTFRLYPQAKQGNLFE